MDERCQLLQAAFHARGLQAGLVIEANLAGRTDQRGDGAARTGAVADRCALRPDRQGLDQGNVVRLLTGGVALLVAQVLHAEVAHRLRGLAHRTGLAGQLAVEAALQFGAGIGLAQGGQHRQQLVTQRQLGQRPLAVALGPGLLQALVLAGRHRQPGVTDQIVCGQPQRHRLHRSHRLGRRLGRGVARLAARRHGQQQHGRQPPSTRRPSSHRHAHAFGLPGPVRILRPATAGITGITGSSSRHGAGGQCCGTCPVQGPDGGAPTLPCKLRQHFTLNEIYGVFFGDSGINAGIAGQRAALAPADHAELGPALAQSQQQRTAGIALAAVDALAAGTDHLAARQITAVGLLAFIERHERHLHRLQLGGIDPAIADVGVAPADHGPRRAPASCRC
ncbi:hypothetical protein G6F68_010183 [Rhizopus microsporus]|nr:hypothetical protein G6F68_010183 [Rhizopus microsporus]